jgi:hypothetical protein
VESGGERRREEERGGERRREEKREEEEKKERTQVTKRDSTDVEKGEQGTKIGRYKCENSAMVGGIEETS